MSDSPELPSSLTGQDNATAIVTHCGGSPTDTSTVQNFKQIREDQLLYSKDQLEKAYRKGIKSNEPDSESDQDSLLYVELPVAAYLREYIDSHSGNPSYQSLSIREPKENPKEIENLKITKLTKMSDAEEAIKKARRTKERNFTQVVLEAEQRGIVSAGQAQEINDLRDELEEEVDES